MRERAPWFYTLDGLREMKIKHLPKLKAAPPIVVLVACTATLRPACSLAIRSSGSMLRRTARWDVIARRIDQVADNLVSRSNHHSRVAWRQKPRRNARPALACRSRRLHKMNWPKCARFQQEEIRGRCRCSWQKFYADTRVVMPPLWSRRRNGAASQKPEQPQVFAVI